MAGEIDPALMDEVHPALTANRTMGSLASIAASRVARYLGAGGPSFAICDEQAGGLRSLALAVESLKNGEIDRAMVGEVSLGADDRIAENWDGASAIVLKRAEDASRDGDRIYMMVDDVEVLDEDSTSSGRAGTLFDLVETCSRWESGIGGSMNRQTFLIRDRAIGPFEFSIDGSNPAGYQLSVTCVEAPDKYERLCSTPALADRSECLFLLSGASPNDLLAELRRLNAIEGERSPGSPGPDNTSPTGRLRGSARRWWQTRKRDGRLGLAFVAASFDELQELIALAESHLRERPNESIADRIYYSPNPLRGDIAFVYPGSGNHFAGMGRELGAAFPHV
jgi:acyl transferase domain-containing protein